MKKIEKESAKCIIFSAINHICGIPYNDLGQSEKILANQLSNAGLIIIPSEKAESIIKYQEEWDIN